MADGAEVPVYGVFGKMENYETTQKDFQGKHVKGLPPDEYKLAPGQSI